MPRFETPAMRAFACLILASGTSAAMAAEQEPETAPRSEEITATAEPTEAKPETPATKPEAAEDEQESQEAPSPWSATVELYGFAPLRTTIDANVGAFSARDDLSLPTILDNLNGLAYIRGSLEYNRVGILTDISYVELGKSGSRSTQGSVLEGRIPITAQDQAAIGFDQGIYDLALRYRFGAKEQAIGNAGDATFIPYAGIRVLDVETDVSIDIQRIIGRRTIERQFSGSAGDPVVQPLIGLQGQVFLSPRLRLFARGDLGGLQDDNLSGNAQIGLGYAVGNSTQLNLSWRYLYLEQERGGSRPRSYDIAQNGVELGLKFFF